MIDSSGRFRAMLFVIVLMRGLQDTSREYYVGEIGGYQEPEQSHGYFIWLQVLSGAKAAKQKRV
jgi:hypothetical protein